MRVNVYTCFMCFKYLCVLKFVDKDKTETFSYSQEVLPSTTKHQQTGRVSALL